MTFNECLGEAMTRLKYPEDFKKKALQIMSVHADSNEQIPEHEREQFVERAVLYLLRANSQENN